MGGTAFEKIVVVTQKTALEELVERYNTRDQARFYLQHMGIPFEEYQAAHDQYQASLALLKSYLPPKMRTQFIERSFVPNFLFDPADLVVTLGRDGLVINTGKYLDGQPLVAFNPDPKRIDGVLIPFHVPAAPDVLYQVLQGRFQVRRVTLAKATLNDGQHLYAVNDLFIGQPHATLSVLSHPPGRARGRSVFERDHRFHGCGFDGLAACDRCRCRRGRGESRAGACGTTGLLQ